MKIVIILLFISGAYTKILQIYPEQFLFANNPTNTIDEISNDDTPVLEIQRLNNEDFKNALQMKMLLNKIEKSSQQSTNKNNMEQTVYFLIKTLRQRNKRFTSPLTYCHFKLCNMGRKRADRLYQMINSEEDNKEA